MGRLAKFRQTTLVRSYVNVQLAHSGSASRVRFRSESRVFYLHLVQVALKTMTNSSFLLAERLRH